MQNLVPFEGKSVIRHDRTQLRVLTDTWTTREATHTRKTCCVDCGTYIDSVPRDICKAASSNRDEDLANRVLQDTTITKRQLDFATWLMMEQISRLSDEDDEQSAIVPLFLIALTAQPSHQLHSFRCGNNPCIPMTTKN